MRLAVQGTIEAAQSALDTGLAVNLSGGYHHASYDYGGGFCAYSDIVIALRALQESFILGKGDSVLYIDLDAHQGNGVERLCQHYRMDEVFIFDMYCEGIYPGDEMAAERIDLAVPMQTGTSDLLYLNTLKHRLPQAITMAAPVFAIYNAGTDILIGDPLGNLKVSAEGVAERDRYVIETCRLSDIPLLILPSGGYTTESHKLLAEMLSLVIGTE